MKRIFILILIISNLYSRPTSELGQSVFEGLGEKELSLLFASWNREMEGEKLHSVRLSDRAGLFIYYSPSYNSELSCWDLKRIYLGPTNVGTYESVISNLGSEKENDTISHFIWFHRRNEPIALLNGAKGKDYWKLTNKMREQKTINFQKPVQTKRLINMIDSILKFKEGEFWIGFHAPYRELELICKLSPDGSIEYRVGQAAIP